MTIRVCSKLCSDHSYNEAEIQLANTMYFLFSDGPDVYAAVDLDPDFIVDGSWHRAAVDHVELDLLNLGLMADETTSRELV